MLSTSSYIKGAVTAFVLFILSDLLWHTVLLGDFYNSRLEAINGAAMTANPIPAMIFEAIAALGSTYFVLALSKSLFDAAKHGAILALMMISAINLVNHTLLLQWDVNLVLVDISWGVVTGLIVGAATYAVAGKRA